MRRTGALAAVAIAAVVAQGCAGSALRRLHVSTALGGLQALSPQEGGVVDPMALRGKVALVTFMATWCAPCLMELPYFKELHAQHAPKGFVVMAVGMDLEGELVLRPFAREYELPFPLVVADDRIRSGQSPFGLISTLPSTFLLGRDGSVIAAFQGMAPQPELSAAVERAMKSTDL